MAGPPGFEPGTSGSAGRRSVLAELRAPSYVSLLYSFINITSYSDLAIQLTIINASLNDLSQNIKT